MHTQLFTPDRSCLILSQPIPPKGDPPNPKRRPKPGDPPKPGEPPKPIDPPVPTPRSSSSRNASIHRALSQGGRSSNTHTHTPGGVVR